MLDETVEFAVTLTTPRRPFCDVGSEFDAQHLLICEVRPYSSSLGQNGKLLDKLASVAVVRFVQTSKFLKSFI